MNRAPHCWHRLTDPQDVQELGAALADLRERGSPAQPGALTDVRSRLRVDAR
ncbi:hypothetical protein [Streptomyces sparsus]